MSEDDFRRICTDTWTDLANQEPWNFELVQNVRYSQSRIGLHVILTQGAHEDMHTAILQSEAFPILRRNRAILYPRNAQVWTVFQIAQFRTLCIRPTTMCCLQWTNGHEEFQACQQENVNAPSAGVLTGFLMNVEQEESDQESDSEVTTQAPSDQLDILSEEEDFSLMSISTPVVMDGSHIPQYPWEGEGNQNLAHDDEIENDEEFDADIYYPPNQEEMILEHFHGQEEEEEYGFTWNVITYGLALTDLGRRDTTLYAGTHHELLDRIYHLWSDHAQYGAIQVWYVTPQPRPRDRRDIVLLVVITMEAAQQEERCVLVVEQAPEEVPHQTRPYGAWIFSGTSAAGVMVGIGHHCCYPFGIRDCSVRLRGQDMTPGRVYPIWDGSLAEVVIEEYPQHVRIAKNRMVNAERFFISARAAFARHPIDQRRVIIRAHGISPMNKPLDSREIVTNFDRLGGLSWIQQLEALWPFIPIHVPRFSFVESMVEDEIDEQATSVLHVIVDYSQVQGMCPVLVSQDMQTRQGNERHVERWAINIPVNADEDTVKQHINFPPFWWKQALSPRFQRNGHELHEVMRSWQPGEILQLHVQVETKADMLHALIQTGTEHEPNMEAIALLQTQFQITKQQPVKYVKASEVHDQTQMVVQDLQRILRNLTNHDWIGLNLDFACIPQMHPAAEWARHAVPQSDKISTRFHVYTDGSSKSGISAWSFIVLCEWDDAGETRYTRVGYSGSQLHHDIGPHCATPADAEATAIIAAAEFLLSRKDKQHLCVHLHFDAKAVGFSAVGLQNLPKKRDETNFRQFGARILLSLLQRSCNSFAGMHVHAHEGQPMNEFVDTVANLCRKGWTCPVVPQLRSRELLCHEYREWAWIEMCPDSHMPGLYEILANAAPDPYKGQGDSLFKNLENKDRQTEDSEYTSVKFATANVGTMNYNETNHEVNASAKANELMQQFHDAGYIIVAIQESRARHTQVLEFGPFIRLISAAKAGLGGVEVWIHKQRIEEAFKCDLVAHKDITVWSQSERHLAVHIQCGSFGMDCLNLYAPQKGRAEEEVQAWWDSIDQIIQDRTWDAPFFMLGDLNCRIGSVISDSIQDLAADIEDTGGSRLREICERQSLLIPSTFGQFHKGPSHTYTGTRGQQTRNDYIAVPSTCVEGIVSSNVDYDIDLLNGGHDHSVVSLELQIHWRHSQTSNVVKAVKYDREAARQAKKQNEHTHAIAPAVPWTIDVNEHWDRVRDKFQQHAVKNFAKQKRQKRQMYISEKAWQILCTKKDIKQDYNAMRKLKRQHILKSFFDAWKSPGSVSQAGQMSITLIQQQEALLFEQQMRLTRTTVGRHHPQDKSSSGSRIVPCAPTQENDRESCW